MAVPEFISAHWRKSTHSNEANACVEVASLPSTVGVRDSKQQGHSPVLAFRRELWSQFVGTLRAGKFDL
ncbi:DUF397 domain-containing protein [Saccharopolyspora sp. 5N708]|uniref:DUF397 domain-containing protein n=1 Tax=Saccharopolyspora sp. 5N708 TaxID=3457424 RepID=UPI003FD4D965